MSRSIWKSWHVDNNIIRRFDELLLIAIDDFLNKFSMDYKEVTRVFLRQNVLEITIIAKSISEEEPIEVWSRQSVILPEFVGFFF